MGTQSGIGSKLNIPRQNPILADLLDKSNEETLIEKPECQKVKCDIERKDKEKRHVWAKRGVIAAMIRLWRFAIFWGI